MLLGQNPGLKRKPRRVRSQSQKIFVLRHHARARFNFLANNVAEHTALFIDVILLGAFELFDHIDRENWQRNQLRVRMLQRSSSWLAMILETQDVLEPPVFLEIKNAVAKSPKHIFNSLR